MTGRHRKPASNSGLQLTRVGVLAVFATAPLVAAGTASASPTTSNTHTPERRSHDHSSDHEDTLGNDDSKSRRSSRSESATHGRTHYLDLAKDNADTPAAPRRKPSGPSSGSTQSTDAQWDRVAECESSQNWSANTGNGYKGGLQFNDSTWRAYGGNAYAPSADKASREEQIAVAKQVQRSQGSRAWPGCGSRLGGT